MKGYFFFIQPLKATFGCDIIKNWKKLQVSKGLWCFRTSQAGFQFFHLFHTQTLVDPTLRCPATVHLS